ncbi:MAG: hypothetical protein ACRED3_15535 [Bradyrhizobium sp.]
MKRITIDVDEDTAAALAARIDDSMPKLKDVARHVLMQTAKKWDEKIGRRQACRCGNLERLANDPIWPVNFDATTNAYEITGVTEHGPARAVVRFCFSCGGTALESKHDQRFAVITPYELSRLTLLCEGVRTLDDALQKFGSPDDDHPSGMMTRSVSESSGEIWTAHRMISYRRLSETAVVHFTQKTGGLVGISFAAKHLGENKQAG